MNGGGVHVKQENMVNSEGGHPGQPQTQGPGQGQANIPPVDIKRELPDHSVLEYEDIDQEHGDSVYGLPLTPNDVMAEDLSIVNDHIQDSGAMDI